MFARADQHFNSGEKLDITLWSETQISPTESSTVILYHIGVSWLCFPLLTHPYMWSGAPEALFQAKEGSVSWEASDVMYCGRCTMAREPNSREVHLFI